MVFFNNCKNRNHLSIYGISDAFYDLQTPRTNEYQGKLATTVNPGEECVVVTTATDRRIQFTRFRFARVEMRPDEHGLPERVFCGQRLASEILSKGDAARHGLYSIFFDKNGHFKQHMVFQR